MLEDDHSVIHWSPEVDDDEISSRPALNSTGRLSLLTARNRWQSFQTVDVRVRGLTITTDATSPSSVSSITASRARIFGTSIKRPVKKILNGVSADFPSQSLTAIIGPSGSGKTTLLNMISDRAEAQKVQKAGSITYPFLAGSPDQRRLNAKPKVAYVLQQDILLPTLTVRETLQYAADLRLSATKTKAMRRAMVETVLSELGLEGCANTRIGNSAHKGCSGGELRRTSIGIQLLANRPILVLDEPTTGLDASSAIQVVEVLQNLVRRGTTVIMTIHQPRSEIWRLTDNVVLLSGGSLLYSGPSEKCLPYFDEMNFKLPAFFNPFDFLVDLAVIDTRSTECERAALDRVQQLQEVWRAKSPNFLDDRSSTTPFSETCNNLMSHSGTLIGAFTNETIVLTRRTFVVTYRDRLGLLASMIESIFMALIYGWIFFQLNSDLSGIRSRQGALYTSCAVQGYLVLIFETYRLSVDIGTFDRERIEGVSRPLSFMLSRRLSRIILEDIPVPLVFGLIFYFMAGFRPVVYQLLTFLLVQVLTHLISVNFAAVCVAVNRQFMGAALLANLLFAIQTFSGGFFINTHSLGVWLRWTKWTSYIFYSFGALCTNEFDGHSYDCPYPRGDGGQACREYTGQYILAALNQPSNWLWRPILVLPCFIVFFFGLSMFILWVKTTELRTAKSYPKRVISPVESAQSSVRNNSNQNTVAITLDNFAMDLETSKPFASTMTKRIFAPINTTFEPNALNVIMGPSGSGKSTCLNAIARRLQDTSLTKYTSTGRILLNGSTATDEVMRSICSYVPQHDDGLLATLTVRETLHFAARLRLPSHLCDDQKIQRAESVILQLGLKESANTLIGSEFAKGISGGEKRRVSIAIQILTDPKILLLDECTSGLDAFTAYSIIEVLKGLAEEGRTIILSIHQPRSDIFQQFSSILLLARGGDVAYTGSIADMLPHFGELGFMCPESINPADFVLDLVSGPRLPHFAQRDEAIPLEIMSASEKQELTVTIRCVQTPPPTISPGNCLTLPAQLGVYSRSQLSFRRAFPILLHRGIINLRRQSTLPIGRVAQITGVGIVLAAFVAPLQNDYYAVQSRVGCILSMTCMFSVGMLNSIAVYPAERDIFYHEDRDTTYPVEAFFCYYSIVEAPFELLGALLFAILTVLAVGLPRTAEQYLLMAYCAFCVVSCGESFGILFLTVFSHTGLAVSVMTMVLSISASLAGVLNTSLSGFWTAVSYSSPVKWQVGALLSYTLRGIKFTCTDEQKLAGGACPIETGEQVLQLYNLDVSTAKFALALGGVTVGYRLLAYLGLKIRKMDWNVSLNRRTAIRPTHVSEIGTGQVENQAGGDRGELDHSQIGVAF